MAFNPYNEEEYHPEEEDPINPDGLCIECHESGFNSTCQYCNESRYLPEWNRDWDHEAKRS